MAKPIPRQIASDSCEVVIDGVPCRPHEGEWVKLISTETVGELRIRVEMAKLTPRLDAVDEGDGGPEARQAAFDERNRILDDLYGEMIGYLSRRVVEWNWTDDLGDPLPQPRGNPEAFRRLRARELYWLMNAVAPAEAEGERKNG